jgi:uncharacterized membrane protein YcaP (DUF421 family)
MHAPMWSDMFHLGLPILEKIIRSVVVYAFLIVGLRLAGKRELAQLNPFDLIVLLTLSNTVQNAIIGDDNSVTGGLIGAATLLFVNYIFVRFLYSHPRIDEAIEGRSDLLVHDGKVLADRCKKELITVTELEAAAHRQGFGSLSEVATAKIEPGGTISFISKKPSPDDERQKQLLDRLDRVSAELAQLRLAQQRPTA